ncbi:S-formylglutathione hydrolase [Stackebrandtia endophytica]|uniref:S-formylglutathione hydrolase n=1 Tax=Stackebrandtia endophytica TaxID=1496996 RepID=A0A543B323_9ACTN|nr:alpha/beta hydrolase-fold protein [Stackebrandtia endophytica]TQL79213.1 S-formylglutathione hydrolase [Stackebrandtia endophytica]
MTRARLHIVNDLFTPTSVTETVDYRVLLPTDWDAAERLPLVLHLHGAMSSSASLELAAPHYEELYQRGEFPRSIVACASTPTVGGFYLNRPTGDSWESLIGEEFPEHLAATFGRAEATALIGASMGGYGALKAAFADPQRYAAVAAISPAVFPGEHPDEVPASNIPSVLGDLHRAMSHGTGEASVYLANSVHGRARAHADDIREASLPVLIDCGAADEFGLHEGADYLHRVLDELAIDHEFRLVEGAGHLGPAAESRTKEAIRFIGTALATR